LSLSELRRRYLPRGPLDLLAQFAVIAAAYSAWRYARGALDGGMAESFAHARDLISVERSLHSFVEIDVQDWAISTGWADEVARWGYANLHFKGSVLALTAIFLGWRGSYGFVRNTVIAAMAISVLGYGLYPTAPPRFIPELGLDPSVTGNSPVLSNPGDPLFNPFAAVPSMHVGLSMIFAWSLALLVGPRPLKALLFAYPLLMTYVVVASGNHFWIDGLFGAFTAAAAAGLATLLAKLNPDWAFGGSPQGPGRDELGSGMVAA
jgi:membrane-associated phospholipid phosphatase